MASNISSVPDEYLCPITRDIMMNPVILVEDGCTYEESAIQSWLQTHNTSPMTNNVLSNRNYTPNRALKSLISDFISREQLSSRVLTQEFLAFNICKGTVSPDWKQKPTIRLKLTLLGSSGVGKTVLAQSLHYGHWPKNMMFPTATVGTDIIFFYLDKLFRNEYVVSIQLNDPPGQERFEAVTIHFFKQCHGALLLTDTTNLDSLDRLENYWYSRLDTLGMDHCQSMLVCTKMDEFENKDKDYRELFLKCAEEFATVHQMPIVHVSAFRGDNVANIFKQLIIQIMENDILINDLIARATSPHDLISHRREIVLNQNSTSLNPNSRYKPRKHKKENKLTCCN